MPTMRSPLPAVATTGAGGCAGTGPVAAGGTGVGTGVVAGGWAAGDAASGTGVGDGGGGGSWAAPAAADRRPAARSAAPSRGPLKDQRPGVIVSPSRAATLSPSAPTRTSI